MLSIGLRDAYNKTNIINTIRDWKTLRSVVQKVVKFKYLGKYITKTNRVARG